MREPHARIGAALWYGVVEEGGARHMRAWTAAEVAKPYARPAREYLYLVAFLCIRPTLMVGMTLASVSFALSFASALPWFVVFVVFVYLFCDVLSP